MQLKKKNESLNYYSNKILCQIQQEEMTNKAHPCPTTSADNTSFTTMVLPFHISVALQPINFLPGSTLAKSCVFADIAVF